jgi:P27 family predicted phage terminase small subunit
MTGKPLPTNLKILRGTNVKHRQNKNEPQPNTDKVEMPKDLSPAAKTVWGQVADQLKECGILTNIDTPALSLYCEAFAKWKEANEMLVKNGPLYKTKNGHVQPSPFISIAGRYFDQCKAMMSEFGMTPSSRSKVVASGSKKKKDADPWDKI